MPNLLNYYPLESIAVLCGLCNIFLAAREHILNWAFGIAAVSLYSVIFFQTKLYADMSLQIVFLILQFYGWYQWLYGSENHSKRVIQKTSLSSKMLLGLSGLFLFGLISWILHAYTDSTTVYLDALTTALSLIAQWMMTRKWLEHWIVWIGIDLISIYMYLQKSLYLTSILYFILSIVCLYGYFHWKRKINPLLFASVASHGE